MEAQITDNTICSACDRKVYEDDIRLGIAGWCEDCNVWLCDACGPDHEHVAVCNSVTEEGDPFVEEVRGLIEAAPALRDAAADALAGWRYIREVHGDLEGVGWDRVESALKEALGLASREPW